RSSASGAVAMSATRVQDAEIKDLQMIFNMTYHLKTKIMSWY
ncbi:hypothetical protein CDAR_474841, partial [Caerostris darwini]